MGGVFNFSIFIYFIFFNFWANVIVYWVADQMDATNAPHNNMMPDCDNIFIVRNRCDEIVSGLTVVLIANNAKNATMQTICNVVFIFPMAKRDFGTGISIFCVPKNSRRPLTYNSRAIIMMIGTMINQKRIINANMINVFATNNLSPM